MGNKWSGQRAPTSERFWRYVKKTKKCWLWIGTRQKPGYGRLGLPGGKRVEYAHRLSWIIHKGPIPVGLKVLHTCDNPPCVRPSHLFLGTHEDNVADMWAKGRQRGQFQRKTHCKRGHELTPENRYRTPAMSTDACLLCTRDRWRRENERTRRERHAHRK